MTAGKKYSLEMPLCACVCLWVCMCVYTGVFIIFNTIIYQNNQIITTDCRSAFQAGLFSLIVKVWEKTANPPHSGYLHCVTLIGWRSPSLKHTGTNPWELTHIHRAHGNQPAKRVTLRNNANRSSSFWGQTGNNKKWQVSWWEVWVGHYVCGQQGLDCR